MANLRLALAQVNPTVGDLAGNALLVREWTARAAAQQAQLVVFTEMVLTGYPVEDLVFRESFVAASRHAVQRLAAELATDGFGELAVVVGYLDADGPAKLGSDSTATVGPRNALAVLHRGKVAARYFKHHLPNYGVFDEDRYFVPGGELTVLRAGLLDGSNVDMALTICEDIWQAGGPFAVAAAAQVGLVLNINASPYEMNKDDQRLPLVQRRAAEAGAVVAYVNTVGGQDELVFDGDSMIVAPDGTLLARGPQLAEALLVHDLTLPEATGDSYPGDLPMSIKRVEIQTAWSELPEGTASAEAGVAARLADEAEIWAALVLGLRDYVHKNGAKSVVVAVSGGIDSAVVATIAADALGGANVVGISMPSGHSSQHSRDDAAELAGNLGIDYRTEPIQHMVDAFLANLNLSGLAVENLQARVRAVILMAVSNQEGHLVLTTGNKSELAVGYTTLYGDSVGAFNPLKDVPKTLVWKLARWRNTVAGASASGARAGAAVGGGVIPANSISKPPSAELRPGQLDTDSLPEYDKLDLILADYIDTDMGRDALVAKGHEPTLVDKVLRLVDGAEYKRRQSAPGTKISFKSFGRDRRLPITNRFREISG